MSLLDTFLDEAEEHLQALESGLMELGTDPDPDLVSRLFRAAHSIKGGAGTCGLDALSHFTHRVENVLGMLRDGTQPATPDLVALLIDANDVLRDFLARAAEGDTTKPEAASELASRLRNVGSQPASTDGGAAKPTATVHYRITFRPSPQMLLRGNDPWLIFMGLETLGELTVRSDDSALPPLRDLDPLHIYLSFRLDLRTGASEEEIRAILGWANNDAQWTLEEVPEARALRTENARAMMHRGGRARAERPSAWKRPRSTRCSTWWRAGDQSVDAAGSGGSVARQPPRRCGAPHDPARGADSSPPGQRARHADGAHAHGVRAPASRPALRRRPQARQGRGPADRGRVDGGGSRGRAAPRRSPDPHGAQRGRPRARDARRSTGRGQAEERPSRGACPPRSRRRGGPDPGRRACIDLERLRRRAEELGVVRPGDDTELTESVLFLPGFSTSSTVTAVSGRGVGLDVVRQNVEALGGDVSIRSSVGRGTTFECGCR